MRTLCFFGLSLWLTTSGCAYRIGSGAVRGALDELSGAGEGAGVEDVGESVLQRALLVELGHQLGQGLSAGLTEIAPEQKAEIERTIDQILAVTARRTGKGLRDEVGPELRNVIRRDIVLALTEGVHGDLSPELEATAERVILRATTSLREGISDPRLRFAIADLLRESVYMAMQEGQGTTPSVAETIHMTLTDSMLAPTKESITDLTNLIGGRADSVVNTINDSAKRTENILLGVIGALGVAGAVVLIAFLTQSRQLRRVREASLQAEGGLRNLDVALDGLDEQSREALRARAPQSPPKPPQGNEGPK